MRFQWLKTGFYVTLFVLVRLLAVAQQRSPYVDGLPKELIVPTDLSVSQSEALQHTARQFYTFWNTGDPSLLKDALAPTFTDRDLPPGRPQGPTGPQYAFRQFHEAVPDLRCEVLQQIIVGDRIVSHLRFTGHFSGQYGNVRGHAQKVDFVATDILRVNANNQIEDNWHLEDNLTFLRQIGVVR